MSTTLPPYEFAQAVDLNGDGRLDVIGASRQSNLTAFQYSYNLGNGDGTFGPTVSLDAAPIAGDFDADGDVDLITLGAPDQFLENVGDADLFADPVALMGIALSGSVVQVIARSGAAGSDILRRTGVGTIQLVRMIGDEITLIDDVSTANTLTNRTADINGDGVEDALVSDGSAFSAVIITADELRLVPLDIDGTFHLADFDGDDAADAVYSESNVIYYRKGAGDGTFAAAQVGVSPVDTERSHFANGFGDFDGDGRHDLVVSTSDGVTATHRVAFGLGDGRFGQPFARIGGVGFRQSTSFDINADFTGDGRDDRLSGLVAISLSQILAIGSSMRVAVDAPQVSAVVAPDRAAAGLPVGLRVTGFSSTIVSGEPAFSIYADVNRSGVLDAGDELLEVRNVRRENDDWIVRVTMPEVAPGNLRLFAVAEDAGLSSAIVEATVSLWARVFHPEGFRNDTTIDERLTLVNPHDVAVPYQVLARYERGGRGGVIASGTLAPNSRKVIVTTAPANPAAALVRRNVGYALEVQSEREIGATLRHVDAGASGAGGIIAASLSGQVSTILTFPSIDINDRNALTLFNHLPTAVDIRIDIINEQGVRQSITMTVAGMRRGGLEIDAETDLEGRRFTVIVAAERDFAAAMSVYRADGVVLGSLDGTGHGVPESVLPAMDFADVVNATLFVTPQDGFGDLEFVLTIETTVNTGPVVTRRYSVPEDRTVSIRLDRLVDDNVSRGAVRIRVESGAAAFRGVADYGRGLVAALNFNHLAAQAWAFGATSFGTASRNTGLLGVYNPSESSQEVAVRYLFADGTQRRVVITVGADRARQINLRSQAALMRRGRPIGIVVEAGSGPIIAGLLVQEAAGGWSVVGTPIGGTISLADL